MMGMAIDVFDTLSGNGIEAGQNYSMQNGDVFLRMSRKRCPKRSLLWMILGCMSCSENVYMDSRGTPPCSHSTNHDIRTAK